LKDPDHQNIHYSATAICEPFGRSYNSELSRAVRGVDIGYGHGLSSRIAKHMAAKQALQYLYSLPEKHPLLSTQ
jgi:dsRNA-specific ribonuclease